MLSAQLSEGHGRYERLANVRRARPSLLTDCWQRRQQRFRLAALGGFSTGFPCPASTTEARFSGRSTAPTRSLHSLWGIRVGPRIASRLGSGQNADVSLALAGHLPRNCTTGFKRAQALPDAVKNHLARRPPYAAPRERDALSPQPERRSSRQRDESPVRTGRVTCERGDAQPARHRLINVLPVLACAVASSEKCERMLQE